MLVGGIANGNVPLLLNKLLSVSNTSSNDIVSIHEYALLSLLNNTHVNSCSSLDKLAIISERQVLLERFPYFSLPSIEI